MYCVKCGARNDDNAYKCGSCGQVLSRPETALAIEKNIPNYLVQAILVTVFCFMPLGVVAIIFAAQVNSKLQLGDISGALDSSNKAKMWCWWSFGVGMVVPVALGIIILIAAAGAFSCGPCGTILR